MHPRLKDYLAQNSSIIFDDADSKISIKVENTDENPNQVKQLLEILNQTYRFLECPESQIEVSMFVECKLRKGKIMVVPQDSEVEFYSAVVTMPLVEENDELYLPVVVELVVDDLFQAEVETFSRNGFHFLDAIEYEQAYSDEEKEDLICVYLFIPLKRINWIQFTVPNSLRD